MTKLDEPPEPVDSEKMYLVSLLPFYKSITDDKKLEFQVMVAKFFADAKRDPSSSYSSLPLENQRKLPYPEYHNPYPPFTPMHSSPTIHPSPQQFSTNISQFPPRPSYYHIPQPPPQQPSLHPSNSQSYIPQNIQTTSQTCTQAQTPSPSQSYIPQEIQSTSQSYTQAKTPSPSQLYVPPDTPSQPPEEKEKNDF